MAEPESLPALPDAEPQVLAVADGREIGEVAAVDEEQHAGVREPERRELAELGAEVERELLPGNDGVDAR